MARIEVFKARLFKEGGGFMVRRTVGAPEMPSLDPWAMLDHFGPVNNAPGTAVGAPDHPHSGVEIMSYMLQGGGQHHDTLGNAITTRRGQCMLMHTGDGLEHSELPLDELLEQGGIMEGFQIWYTLPKASRMGPPAFQKMTEDEYVTCIDASTKVKVKVIVGKTIVDGVERVSKASHRWPITYLDVRVKPYGSFSHKLEGKVTSLVYCYRGSLFVSTDDKNERQLQEGDQAQVISDEPVTVRLRTNDASSGRALVLSAKPHGEEVFKHGGLLATSREELDEILQKARSGGFGTIPGAEERRKKTQAALKKKQQSEKH